MALIIADRVLEQSTTTGTGPLTLAGASLGFRSFASVCAVSDTVWYYIESIDTFGKPTGEYEYGLGTYSAANQLTRTTVRGSSNAGLAVDFTAGIKLVGIGVLAPNSSESRAEWRAAIGQFADVRDGVTSAVSAIATADALGLDLVFSAGSYLIDADLTISNRCVVDPDAKFVVASGKTLTLNGLVTAGRHLVFDGLGSVILGDEETHFVYPEWFGAFADMPGTNASPLLQKLSSSIITGRECLVDFGPGTWYLGSDVSWSRACRIRGSGERITHFRCNGSFPTGDVFTTAEQGVQFENIQFSSATTPRASGSYIKLGHNYCKARGIWATDGFVGVQVSGNLCEVDSFTGFTWSSAAGSAIVDLANGFLAADVDRIKYIDIAGTHMPEFLVNTNAHTHFNINRLYGRGVTTVLGLGSSSGTGGRGHVGQVTAQSPTVNGVRVKTTGTGAVVSVKIDDIMADNISGIGLEFRREGSGIMKYLTVDNLDIDTAATGFKCSGSAGQRADHWQIKGGSVRSCSGNGFDVADAYYWQIADTFSLSNAGVGTTIANTCGNFSYNDNQNRFNGTNLVNNGTGTNNVSGNLS